MRPLRFLLESLSTTFFPAPCSICGDPLLNFSRTPVCAACMSAIAPVSCAQCEVCGDRLLLPVLAHPNPPQRCGICLRYPQPYRRAVAYASYSGELRELLHLLKYSRITPAAAHLGRLLARAMARLQSELAASPAPVLVIPVPLHAAQRRARGFNQSELIVKSALRQLPQPGFPRRYMPHALVRIRATESQTGLSGHQRRANLRNAFAVRQPQAIRGARILLVDDVFTTGSTVAACARTLNAAGADGVWVATIARVYRFSAAELDRWHFTGPESPELPPQHPTRWQEYGDRTAH